MPLCGVWPVGDGCDAASGATAIVHEGMLSKRPHSGAYTTSAESATSREIETTAASTAAHRSLDS